MPQLIAMIIVVVGAMIYMFQTFGGTGDKIEGVAQKTSIITEVNNIKNGVKLAARSGHVAKSTGTANAGAAQDMRQLGQLNYFAQQINEQLAANTVAANANNYYAISFGIGTATDPNEDMIISLVNNRADVVPGLYVDFSQGTLASNAGFLEAQIANDLEAIARIDRKATAATAATGKWGGATTGIDSRIPAATTTGGSDTDGKFIIYFTDFASNELVVDTTATTNP
jgi:hypothetical protein